MTLEARDLGCIRGERRLFQGLGFTIGPGEALIVEGPNGTGKSSLLRLLAGFLAPAEGAVRWAGTDIAEAPEEHRRRIGWAGHLDALKPAFTVAENLAFWAAALGTGRPALRRAQHGALETLGLDRLADLPARFLSAGQKRRLALARLAVDRRPLWLLDEPTTALDAEGVATFRSILEAHLAADGLAIIASHLDLGLPTVSRLRLGRTP